MIWSISGSKLFKTCPRQWYYKNIVADGRVKNDPYRREVTILSKLQSLEAFRGKIVDDIISRKVINTINRKYTLKKDYFIKEALTAFENQLLFARLQNYREEGFKLSGDENFAALFDYEFKGSISVKDLEDAKADIVEAISNFIDNKELIEYLNQVPL